MRILDHEVADVAAEADEDAFSILCDDAGVDGNVVGYNDPKGNARPLFTACESFSVKPVVIVISESGNVT
jgi:hypothetical protein